MRQVQTRGIDPYDAVDVRWGATTAFPQIRWWVRGGFVADEKFAVKILDRKSIERCFRCDSAEEFLEAHDRPIL